MDREDIPFLSVGQISRLIREKEVSPVEVTRAYLERIDDLDFKFNSYLTVCRKEATQAAQEAERAIVNGGYLGPLHGIPVAVKDQLWTKGIRTTGGSRLLADFIPQEDATTVSNLKKNGAVILGKTNLTEFALMGLPPFSVPRNPWDLDMYAGGSSGGSTAATSAFLCATSIGEDTGGSIRVPASWCGLVGLRPSWGRVSRYGLIPGVWSMDTIGPISRTVEDAAITLSAIAGHDPKDPYTWNSPVPDYRESLNGDIRGLRIGVVTEEMYSPVVEPEVRDATAKAVSLLAGLVALVEEVSIPLAEHSTVISRTLVAVEPALYHRRWLMKRLDEYGHPNRIGLLTGSIIPASTYYKAQKLRSLLRQQVLESLRKYDVLITPTSGRPAQEIADDPVIMSKEMASHRPYLLTRLFNLTNSPAISIPCGFTAKGLPIGLQIGSRPGGDATVLKVAHAFEQHTPWHTMRPPTA